MAEEKIASVVSSRYGQDGAMGWVSRLMAKYATKRESFDLPNPGSVDNIKREVDKDVFLTKYMFTGLKADFNRPLSMMPLFQYSHSFSMGSQMPPYGFSALFGNQGLFLQGNIDNEGQFGASFNYRLSKNLITKTQASIAPGQQGMLQIDTDYTGKDFTASLKAINPSLLEGGLTGIFVGSYLQSVTSSLALGVESVWQRLGMSQGPETVQSYCARYKGDDWIASAQITGQGAMSASYWRRLAERVEAGADLSLQFAPGLGASAMMGAMGGKDGTATAGVKYDFRMSTFRAQLDSTGKVSCLLEKRVLQPLSIAFAGEMDHAKNQAKVGMSVSIEVMPEDLAEQMQLQGDSPTNAVPF